MSINKWIGAGAGWFLGGGPIGAIIGYYIGKIIRLPGYTITYFDVS